MTYFFELQVVNIFHPGGAISALSWPPLMGSHNHDINIMYIL